MSFSLPLPSVPFSLPLSPSLPIPCSRSLSLFLTHADAVVRPQSCQTRAQRWCISLRCAFDRPVARDFFSLSLSVHRFSISIPLSLSSTTVHPESSLYASCFIVHHSPSPSTTLARPFPLPLILSSRSLIPPFSSSSSFSLVHFPLASSSGRLLRFALFVSPVTPFNPPGPPASTRVQPTPSTRYPPPYANAFSLSLAVVAVLVCSSLVAVDDDRRHAPIRPEV